ncbi:MAG: dTMP kinase [Pseudomonadota bacterium]
MTEAGRFITLEGGEGAGKSTLIAGLRTALETRGLDVRVTREPGGTALAERVRTLALTPPDGEAWSPLAHALLMNTARQDHLEKLIRPALAQGAWVVCDRFADSTLVYQSIEGVPVDVLQQLQEMIVGETQPDLTLILDAPPEALFDRRTQRAICDVFEAKDLSFHQDVRRGFQAIADRAPKRCHLVDALAPPEAVLAAALRLIDQHLIPA